MQNGNVAGLDLHKRFSQVCVMSQEGEEILNRSFKHTFEGLIEMSQALGGCSTVAMEACWGWEAMSDFLDGLGKHGMIFEGSDLFGVSGRKGLEERLSLFSEGYRGVIERALKVVAVLNELMVEIEARAKKRAKEDTIATLLQTIPGIGWWSAILIRYEIDDVERFPRPGKLVSYCGICPSVHGTGGPEKYRYGRMTKQGNAYLRHIFMEDAIPAKTSHKPWSLVYERVKAAKGGNVAKGAVAHRMVEAVYWVWKKRQAFHPRDMLDQGVSSKESSAPLLAS
ncbi:MAG: transposase [Nitrospirae bacterium]|nr:transposase [Nitrospirota bacterium]